MNLREKLLALMAEVNQEVVEREELIELIAIALLTRNNLFILGKPGQAKSHSINRFRRRITGARQFERLLSKQTDEDQLFGRIDLSSLIPGAVPESVLQDDAVYCQLREELELAMQALAQTNDAAHGARVQLCTDRLEQYRRAVAALHANTPTVQTSGKIPEADIVFLDECFKANDGVLNSLLTALNERKYTNEGRTYAIPTISFFAASNEIPNFSDPQEKILGALYDRLQIKVVTEDIGDRSRRLAVLRQKQHAQGNVVSATITLEELLEMQQAVRDIPVPESINILADDILCELRNSGVTVSDRKYLNYYPLAQAKAWLEGHDSVQPQDLLILRCYLWHLPADRPTVDAVLQRLCLNPLQDKADTIRAMALEVQQAFDEARADADRPSAASKALIKLRSECVRLYQMQQELAGQAQTAQETELVMALLEDLEQISRKAHEAVGFTPAPLAQLSALQ